METMKKIKEYLAEEYQINYEYNGRKKTKTVTFYDGVCSRVSDSVGFEEYKYVTNLAMELKKNLNK